MGNKLKKIKLTKRGIKIKKRGSFILEVLIVLGIVSLMSSFVFFKYNKLNEQRDLEKAVDVIENVIYRYSLKSLESLSAFDIEIDYDIKELSIRAKGLDHVIESIELPQKLKYATFYNKASQEKGELSINTNGNFSTSFSIYICGYDGTALYRIAFYSFNKSHLAKINIYRNVNGKKIKFENLFDFHYGEDEVKKGWVRL